MQVKDAEAGEGLPFAIPELWKPSGLSVDYGNGTTYEFDRFGMQIFAMRLILIRLIRLVCRCGLSVGLWHPSLKTS